VVYTVKGVIINLFKGARYMALIQCPECKKEISDFAESCPHCGYPIKKIMPKTLVSDLKVVAEKSNTTSNNEVDIQSNSSNYKPSNDSNAEMTKTKNEAYSFDTNTQSDSFTKVTPTSNTTQNKNSDGITGVDIFTFIVMSLIVAGIAWFLSCLFNPIFIWIIAFSVILIVIPLAISQNKQNEKTRATQKEQQQEYIVKKCINISREYNYSNISNIVRFIVDESNKKVHISYNSSDFKSFDFSEIIGCEILSDDQVTGGVKRAILGGVLAGEAGAIVGAVTAKKHILSYKIVFYINNISNPKYELQLINWKISTTDKDYTNAVSFAGNISATIKAIINRS